MWRMAVFSLGMCLSLPAAAANLSAVEGSVLINHGSGFERVASGAAASQGDLIVAKPGGSAKLVYPGGCVTKIKPGAVVAVHDDSHCPKPMLVGEGNESCDQYQDQQQRDRCWCRTHRNDITQDREEYRARCGVVWWPTAVGFAAPLTAYLISIGNEHHGGGGGGGGPSP